MKAILAGAAVVIIVAALVFVFLKPIAEVYWAGITGLFITSLIFGLAAKEEDITIGGIVARRSQAFELVILGLLVFAISIAAIVTSFTG